MPDISNEVLSVKPAAFRHFDVPPLLFYVQQYEPHPKTKKSCTPHPTSPAYEVHYTVCCCTLVCYSTYTGLLSYHVTDTRVSWKTVWQTTSNLVLSF